MQCQPKGLNGTLNNPSRNIIVKRYDVPCIRRQSPFAGCSSDDDKWKELRRRVANCYKISFALDADLCSAFRITEKWFCNILSTPLTFVHHLFWQPWMVLWQRSNLWLGCGRGQSGGQEGGQGGVGGCGPTGSNPRAQQGQPWSVGTVQYPLLLARFQQAIALELIKTPNKSQ